MFDLPPLRHAIRKTATRNEADILGDLIAASAPDVALRDRAVQRATGLVQHLRTDASPGLMEVFLAEYGLSTDEGIALMCLAEALLRVPDNETIDALIEDKIAPSAWGKHLGHSSSSLVNASTWALMLTGRVLRDDRHTSGIAATLHSAVKRVGEPVIRTAVARAMKELGAQFVLGQTVDEAMERGQAMNAKGYTYSYDMLGEASLTEADARTYFQSYAQAITALSKRATQDEIARNPGISIKLSALHPRYEVSQRERVMSELVERTAKLVRQARDANMGLNIDAEEADRLDLSLDVIEAVLSDPALAGWDGFGVVVQAYGTRAAQVIDWLNALAIRLDRRIMVRLVKGAYWDTEIKRAQVEGLPRFPVFTNKSATDAAWICCAAKLLGMTDRIYPQFATHNAHSVATVIELAQALDVPTTAFEFQRLHGMGEALHARLAETEQTRCRIYAPVGAHRDLLAYLVRRLLENGANSSFVNQVLDEDVPATEIAADPFATTDGPNDAVKAPADLFAPERANSRGWDLRDLDDLAEIDAAMQPFLAAQWNFGGADLDAIPVANPANPTDVLGNVGFHSRASTEAAIGNATAWEAPATQRAKVLNKAADLYEANFGELFAALTREAGKTRMDAIAELREAVDFLRYYAARGTEVTTPARGLVTCISPWNFPLAIFTGQLSAALAAGNAVLAKPAEQTSLTAHIAVDLLHKAGVPQSALTLLPGKGAEVGAALTSDPRINGVCFTGSTQTAQHINRAMAESLAPSAPLIAETGGLNAMIVDSTALPEQAIRDILASSFQSAGQRCSALRVLYVQEDIAQPFLRMLYGAMDELRIGDPMDLATDVGPVIDEAAAKTIRNHVEIARQQGRILKEMAIPDHGTFVAPTVLKVNGIADLDREIFGPILHVTTYAADQMDRVIDEINATGYGLTFGMHSRIDDRIEQVTSHIQCGNLYINRNQIGAIVGSQPFGGEGMSGTGPKAGGPDYVARFVEPRPVIRATPPAQHTQMTPTALRNLQRLIDGAGATSTLLSLESLPGPTGESNRLSTHGRGTVLCLGPSIDGAIEQARLARAAGCAAIIVADGVTGQDAVDGTLPAEALRTLEGIHAVISWHPAERQRAYRIALAKRPGALIPLVTDMDVEARCRIERHVCIDTTAAGGNASLLAGAS